MDISPSPEGAERLARMVGVQWHRGPDGKGAWSEEGIHFGHCRLAIIDLATGAQPMASTCGRYVITYNGELYNYHELQEELAAGYRFATASDTEVILAAFARWGKDSFSRLNGIYAFAIYDRQERRLYLVRDPFGVKPLYWARTGRAIYFASEIKAILAVAPQLARLSRAGLAAALEWRYFPAPLTPFEGVAKVRAGCWLVAGIDGKMEEGSFAPPRLPAWHGSADEALERLDVLAREAVRRQLAADVPVGVLLSGGIDSALVASYAAESYGQGRMTAFTVGFEGGYDKDEVALAAGSAAALGMEHHSVAVAPGHFSELMEQLVWHLEEPVATTSAVPLFLLSREIARTHKVVLSGQGADELFGGYPRHLAEALRHNFSALACFLPSAAADWPMGERLAKAVAVAAVKDDEDRYARSRWLFSREERRALLKSDLLYRDHLAAMRPGMEGRNALAKALFLDLHTQLPDDLLLYTDKASMAHGVEVRVPFLDLPFVSFTQSLPSSLKVRGLQRKWLFRRLAARRLPPFIMQRRKIGFETPVEQWFRKELSGAVRETLTGSGCRLHAVLDKKSVERMVTEHLAGRQENAKRLFMLVLLELWLRRFGVSV